MEKRIKDDVYIEVMINLYQYDLYQDGDLHFIPFFELQEAHDLYQAVLGNLKAVDQTIEANLFDYRLSRLSYLDRALIRLATYQMQFTDVAKAIVINVVVELTKTYSNLDDQKQHRFTNRLLDNIAKSLEG